jgi:hypothetical protein
MREELQQAINIEKDFLQKYGKLYYAAFYNKIKDLGYSSVDEYLNEKRDTLFAAWHPELYVLDAADVASNVSKAITKEQDCIFMCKGEGIHAFHGDDEINLDLCNNLSVKVVELNYHGGTIIGSAEDLSMLIIFPRNMGMREQDVTQQFLNIIGPEAYYDDNDIMLHGKKVAGITWRDFENVSVYTIQVSFRDYSDYISQICKKEAKKIPGFISSDIVTRDELESKILAWINKENN